MNFLLIRCCYVHPLLLEYNYIYDRMTNNFENHIHINPIGVGPCMLEILFQALFQWIWDLEKEINITEYPLDI